MIKHVEISPLKLVMLPNLYPYGHWIYFRLLHLSSIKILQCNTTHLFSMIFYNTFIYFKKEICHIKKKLSFCQLLFPFFADCYLFLEKKFDKNGCLLLLQCSFREKSEDFKEWAFLQSLNVVKMLQKL